MLNKLSLLLNPNGGGTQGGQNALSGFGLRPLYGGQSNALTTAGQATLIQELASALSPSMKWVAVRQRFELFNENITLTPLQRQDGYTKRNGVIGCLNRYYYESSSDTDNSFFIGSWGKGTTTRPPRDVDLYFVLPHKVYSRFEGRIYNRQSALLQEVKMVLGKTYPDTDMKGDGQVVLVNFGSYNVEVVPAFLLNTGRYWICDTENEGSYKVMDPNAEVKFIESVDLANNLNLRPLIRMLKAWQNNCVVPIKSFQLELLAADFLQDSPWRRKDFFWFDWIARDFFAYLYNRANTDVVVKGTGEKIFLGDEWQSRALTAFNRAVKACDYEKLNTIEQAGEEWQKIFGQQVPRTV